MTDRTASARAEFETQGYTIIRGAFAPGDFAPFSNALLDLVRLRTGRRFGGLRDPALCAYFNQHRDVESDVYNGIRTVPELAPIARDARIADGLRQLAPGRAFGLMEKLIVRIDLPGWEHEIAHWHQDYAYVQGNTETVTVWIPLQAVNPENGCLLIAPASHRLGPVNHARRIGKRQCPPPELVETFKPLEARMEFGDVLLFHALLFHSGQLNRSALPRYSFQFRYSPLGLPTNPEMGRLLPLADAVDSVR